MRNFRKTAATLTNLEIASSYGKVGNTKSGVTCFTRKEYITIGGNVVMGSLGLGQIINQGLLREPEYHPGNTKNRILQLDLQILERSEPDAGCLQGAPQQYSISQRGTVPEFRGCAAGQHSESQYGAGGQ